jgi:hypothetical protein
MQQRSTRPQVKDIDRFQQVEPCSNFAIVGRYRIPAVLPSSLIGPGKPSFPRLATTWRH